MEKIKIKILILNKDMTSLDFPWALALRKGSCCERKSTIEVWLINTFQINFRYVVYISINVLNQDRIFDSI